MKELLNKPLPQIPAHRTDGESNHHHLRGTIPPWFQRTQYLKIVPAFSAQAVAFYRFF